MTAVLETRKIRELKFSQLCIIRSRVYPGIGVFP